MADTLREGLEGMIAETVEELLDGTAGGRKDAVDCTVEASTGEVKDANDTEIFEDVFNRELPDVLGRGGFVEQSVLVLDLFFGFV